MSPGRITVEAITARVDKEKCTSCGICAKVCPYNAVTVDVKSKKPASVIQAACAGCGTCAAECPFDAIEMTHFTDPQILSQVGPPGPGAGEQDRLLCLQLVLLRWRRFRRGLPAGISPQHPFDPDHVLGPGGREVHLGRL